MNDSLFTLTRRKKTRIFYARFRLPDGSWSTAKSTRTTNRVEAQNWCNRYLMEHGRPITRHRVRFDEYALSMFLPNGPYQTRMENYDRPVTTAYLTATRSRVKNYLVPVFGKRYVDEITAADVERALLSLKNDGTIAGGSRPPSPRTLNAIRSTLRQIFAEAVRQRLIERNPVTAETVPQFRETPKKRGVLSPNEIRALLSPANIPIVWQGNVKYWLLTACAALTGARQGELRTLHVEDIGSGYIHLRRSWDNALKCEKPTTKNGDERIAAIPETIETTLRRWTTVNKLQPAQYVFFGDENPDKPVSQQAVLRNFRKALTRSGIPQHVQRTRNLLFHSLRHSVAANLAAEGVDVWQIQQTTGHKSRKVLERYLDHQDALDWTRVREWQSSLLPS